MLCTDRDAAPARGGIRDEEALPVIVAVHQHAVGAERADLGRLTARTGDLARSESALTHASATLGADEIAADAGLLLMFTVGYLAAPAPRGGSFARSRPWSIASIAVKTPAASTSCSASPRFRGDGKNDPEAARLEAWLLARP